MKEVKIYGESVRSELSFVTISEAPIDDRIRLPVGTFSYRKQISELNPAEIRQVVERLHKANDLLQHIRETLGTNHFANI